MKTIHVMFTKITPQEWTAFRLACLINGQTMTRVLGVAIREYIENTEKNKRLASIGEGGKECRIDV